MSDRIPPDAWGTCHADGCGQPTPWDMSAIVLNHKHAFCSPPCAMSHMDETDIVVSTVVLHDPQYRVDRGKSDVDADDDAVTLRREVEHEASAYHSVERAKVLHDGPFRGGG